MLGFSAISLAAPKISLEDDKNNYTQTENGYVVKFKLTATSSELNSINLKVEDLKDRLSMTRQELGDNQYNCVFTVNHQNNPEYVYKMLLSIGINTLEYKGQTHSIDKIIEILYSYQ